MDHFLPVVDTAHWMANKFQTAMPGALLGLEHVISFMLQHFWLLYAGIIIFSAAEFFVGAFLIIGLFTRISAFISMIFSVLLMLMFGWQGATCIDEWTMAACNLAMGATIFLCGSPHYAVDNIILRVKFRGTHLDAAIATCSGDRGNPGRVLKS